MSRPLYLKLQNYGLFITVIPRAYQDQFRGFESHRCMLVGTFSCIKIDWREAREREILIAAFDENQRAEGMLNPVRDKQ